MLDFTDFREMTRTHDDYLLRLFKLIEEKGGYVEQGVALTPSFLKEHAFNDSSNDWIQQYFGETFHDWSAVNDRAIQLSDVKTEGLNLPEAMIKLKDNVNRMKKAKNLPILQNLDKDLSCIGRFRAALELCLTHEAGIYNSDTTEPVGLAHYLDYIYKFSPLSFYQPEVYHSSLLGYSETRKLDLSDDDLDIISDFVVWYQRVIGVLDNVRKHDPVPLEETQIEALERNPTSAYSLPTMMNAKNKEAREIALAQAAMYKADPGKYGNMPSIQNLRIQQGGNILDKLIVAIDPGFNPKTMWPSLQQFDAAMERAWLTRPRLKRYIKTAPCDYNPKYMLLERLPGTVTERESLVKSGTQDDAILLQHPDGSFKFDFLLEEANPWKLVSEKFGSDSGLSESVADQIFNKNRVVFAAAAPVTLNMQSFIHLSMDIRRDSAIANGHQHLVSQWKSPEYLLEDLTNMWAAVNSKPNARKLIEQLTDEERAVCGCLTGDDKSSFDNYQSIVFHQLFNCCVIGPIFKPEHHELYKWCSIASICPRLLTSWGEMRFSESMPSGHGTTNDQDTFISDIAGILDICKRARVRPQVLFNLWFKMKFGMLAQGDDFESTDVANPVGEDKEANAAKLGLILAADKSLMSPHCLEFTRKFANGEWRYDHKEYGIDCLCLHAPVMHSLVKQFFSEHAVKNPPAVASIAQISRLGNIILHPNAVAIIQQQVLLDPLKCGTKPTYYVPAHVMGKWRDAGEPEPPSEYHVLIENPQQLYKVAGEEATAKGDSIDHLVKGWRAASDMDEKFEDQIIVKLLTAIANGNQAYIAELQSRVHSS